MSLLSSHKTHVAVLPDLSYSCIWVCSLCSPSKSARRHSCDVRSSVSSLAAPLYRGTNTSPQVAGVPPPRRHHVIADVRGGSAGAVASAMTVKHRVQRAANRWLRHPCRFKEVVLLLLLFAVFMQIRHAVDVAGDIDGTPHHDAHANIGGLQGGDLKLLKRQAQFGKVLLPPLSSLGSSSSPARPTCSWSTNLDCQLLVMINGLSERWRCLPCQLSSRLGVPCTLR
eukprot:TRINITY_DN490_c0_g1_i7.p1 TRINITY_DN490_c0_g1~~TRINITY_DN490_c0_g1_i7.p1  ORF type:complete len:226 (+),score=3.78 TRINITY_DN490_c0_g1_i7:1585-2262(+)